MTRALEWREAGPIRYLEVDLGHGKAVFSTRLGGLSDGAYEALNLGTLTGDDLDRVARNRALLAHALERDPQRIVFGRQVHGTAVEVRIAPNNGEPNEADAQLTGAFDLTPLVLVADCIPLALAAPGGAAMVHCGWRGLAGGIVPAAIDALCRQTGSRATEIRAAVGPGIGPCCYEVGDEVIHAFAQLGHKSARMLDLPAIVTEQLISATVPADSVVTSGLCTSCNPELFFSHRRDHGRTGRQAGLAWLN